MQKTNLILLPGLDGTGQLFNSFLKTLPPYLSPHVISYPVNEFLDYDALVEFVKEKIPLDMAFILLAESFSGPIALKLAATKPHNLIALILCATFVSNPTPFTPTIVSAQLCRLLFKLPMPVLLLRYLLIGMNAEQDLVDHFQRTIQMVAPDVLADRLKSILSVNVRDTLRVCEKPLLYLQAKHDKLLGERCLQEILSLNPNVKSVTIDAPHLLLQRKPFEAVKAIEDFLQNK